MEIILGVIVAIVFFVLWIGARARAATLQTQLSSSMANESQLRGSAEVSAREIGVLREQLHRAKPYLEVADAVAEAQRVSIEALEGAEKINRDAREQHRERVAKADELLQQAGGQAKQIILDATKRAQEIAGDAYKALKNADHLKGVVDAMRNKIEGYGDRYLEPTYSLLDQLAETFGFAEAGQQLKLARERTQLLVDQNRAATCNYVEEERRQFAIAFVLDAFNGKVDSILSRTKTDNIGTLQQQIRDAFSLVNYNGKAFRDAQVTQDYLEARLQELQWAVATIQLREKDREEQRLIKARIREEEKAQREFERARRDAEKEEAAVRKAMERMVGVMEKATEAQRAKYEQQLTELSARLVEAEAKGQRALSMAQQTKTGHVYVISNVGSFGEGVVKIGMTRRLEPADRIKELGDASVPFGFDVHAMIYATDAPKLERELHRRFLLQQINKVNPRKEFFRVSISELKEIIEQLGLHCAWTLAAEAAEYRESISIEEKIKSDPLMRQHWIEHQMLEDPVAEETEDEEASV